MVEFGEELIIDSFRIPWLIWIQVIVMLLLLLLIYSFSLVTSSSSDLSPDDPLCCSSPPSSSSQIKLQQQVGEITGASSRSSISRNKSGNHQEGRSRSIRNNDNVNKEGGTSALINDRSISSQSLYNNTHHPCNIVRLAKIAFLKCLGLDNNPTTGVPSRRSSSSRETHE
ncbi:uncharacterized protein LOC116208075 [Punica granatum]|uniref:Uncharacterized protein LOC116208075 n=1 Tax=Punica granatum TaxID=22663 RepID=A0A6P8DXU4_PUNGR|nr:uncharacterized protein LOC116208075 [Punica granatum]